MEDVWRDFGKLVDRFQIDMKMSFTKLCEAYSLDPNNNGARLRRLVTGEHGQIAKLDDEIRNVVSSICGYYLRIDLANQILLGEDNSDNVIPEKVVLGPEKLTSLIRDHRKIRIAMCCGANRYTDRQLFEYFGIDAKEVVGLLLSLNYIDIRNGVLCRSDDYIGMFRDNGPLLLFVRQMLAAVSPAMLKRDPRQVRFSFGYGDEPTLEAILKEQIKFYHKVCRIMNDPSVKDEFPIYWSGVAYRMPLL